MIKNIRGTEIKETAIPVKMITPKRYPGIKCTFCGKEDVPYMIRVCNRVDICYTCVEDINNATMYDTRCPGCEFDEHIPASALGSVPPCCSE
jgi:hypothetical protein